MLSRRAPILHLHTAAALLFGVLIGSTSTASAQPFVSVQQCEAAWQSAHESVMAGQRAINQCMQTTPSRIGEGAQCNASDQIVIVTRAWPQCGRYEYQVCEARNRIRQIQAECQRLRAQGLEEERRQRAAEQADREARERERRQQAERMRDGWRGWAQEAVGAGRHQTGSSVGTPGALQRLHQLAARTQQAMALARSAEALTGLARGFGADPQQLDAISTLFAPLLSRNPGIAAIQSIALGQVLSIYQDLFRELDSAAAAFAAFSVERDMAAAYERSGARLREVAAVEGSGAVTPPAHHRVLAERAEAVQRLIADSERARSQPERQAASQPERQPVRGASQQQPASAGQVMRRPACIVSRAFYSFSAADALFNGCNVTFNAVRCSDASEDSCVAGRYQSITDWIPGNYVLASVRGANMIVAACPAPLRPDPNWRGELSYRCVR